MITLTLLHPIQSIPVQTWTFDHEPIIRIGRSTDNHVILYSAVVSRHHVELRQVGSAWEIVNLGANGTYLDGKRITQVPAVDGVIIRLARSGPNIQIHLGSAVDTSSGEDMTLAQRIRSKPREVSSGEKEVKPPVQVGQTDIHFPTTDLPAPDNSDTSNSRTLEVASRISPAKTVVGARDLPTLDSGVGISPCTHPRARAETLFCPDCGQPLQVLQTIGEYQVIKILSRSELAITQLGWRNGQTLVMRTLTPDGLNQANVVASFEQQAEQLLKFQHPGMPKFIDFLKIDGYPYLIHEQVYGQDLHQRVAVQGPLSQAQAIDAILQVCDVLSYLHQQVPPFVHQDIKPENLLMYRTLVQSASEVVMVGFISLKSFATKSLFRSNGYSAPEQQEWGATVASDLFALGPTLVYLLTGQEPSAFYAQREQGFRFYPEYIPGLSAELTTIIRRLTSPEPDDRYSTAREVADALNQARSAEKL